MESARRIFEGRQSVARFERQERRENDDGAGNRGSLLRLEEPRIQIVVPLVLTSALVTLSVIVWYLTKLLF